MKIGIIGTGNVAVNNYLPCLSKHHDFEFIYLSRTRSKVEKCVEKFGGIIVDSPAEMMKYNPDLIFVLTLEDKHYDLARELLKYHPKRLFFEKPLHARNGQAHVCENDFWEARKLLNQAEELGVETAIGFNYRFFETSKQIFNLVADKAMGELIQASFFVNYACWSHCIDLFRWLGGEPLTVTALNGNTEWGEGTMRAYDLSCALVMKNGGSATILGTSSSALNRPLYQALLNYEKGMITFGDLDAEVKIRRENSSYIETQVLLSAGSPWIQYGESFVKSIEAYLASVEKRSPPPVPAREGLRELQFEAALRRSAATGKPVEIEKEFPLDV